MSLEEALQVLGGSRRQIRFRDLLAICRAFFGDARIHGSHHVFKMPWPGDPRINLQEDGSQAKPYQVQQGRSSTEEVAGTGTLALFIKTHS